MRLRMIWLAALGGGAVLLSPISAHRAAAQAPAAALTGQVTSAEEGAMEGVLVSAKKDSSTITVTVVSDKDGRFAFPAGKISPGHYALRIRATGYELDGPQAADVAAQPAAIDLKLRKTSDLAAQLTSTEWLMSMPGTGEQKRPLIECMSCHTLERVLRSKFDADGFMPVFRRMNSYANNTILTKVQKRVADRDFPEERARKVAEYLASVNLSGSRETWNFPLKTLPRPSGAATKVVITEYDMPRATIAPHDVRTDANGNIWYSNFVENFLGWLDPKTGAHKEFPYPTLKPGYPDGALALEPDPDGNWWLALMFQAGLARFDVKTEKFQLFPVQSELNKETTQQSLMMPWSFRVDGKVWTNDVGRMGIMRLDLASGNYEFIDPFKFQPKGRQHSPYGMAADASNNLYFMDFADENVGRIDAKTKAPTIYPTPTSHSRPRRTMLDDQGRLWFAEFAANKLGMFDLENEKMKEWDVPTPHTYPYDVFMDKTGALWSGNMSSDRILRFDPESSRAVEYLLPHSTNIRRIFIDNTTTPVTFWAGNNHHAAIIKLEPVE